MPREWVSSLTVGGFADERCALGDKWARFLYSDRALVGAGPAYSQTPVEFKCPTTSGCSLWPEHKKCVVRHKSAIRVKRDSGCRSIQRYVHSGRCIACADGIGVAVVHQFPATRPIGGCAVGFDPHRRSASNGLGSCHGYGVSHAFGRAIDPVVLDGVLKIGCSNGRNHTQYRDNYQEFNQAEPTVCACGSGWLGGLACLRAELLYPHAPIVPKIAPNKGGICCGTDVGSYSPPDFVNQCTEIVDIFETSVYAGKANVSNFV